MSRSYKKTCYCGDKKGNKKKRIANHTVRNYLKNFNHTLSGNDFKKVFPSYEICDFGWLQSWEAYWSLCLKDYKEHPDWYKIPPNQKEEYRWWYKHYKMK